MKVKTVVKVSFEAHYFAFSCSSVESHSKMLCTYICHNFSELWNSPLSHKCSWSVSNQRNIEIIISKLKIQYEANICNSPEYSRQVIAGMW